MISFVFIKFLSKERPKASCAWGSPFDYCKSFKLSTWCASCPLGRKIKQQISTSFTGAACLVNFPKKILQNLQPRGKFCSYNVNDYLPRSSKKKFYVLRTNGSKSLAKQLYIAKKGLKEAPLEQCTRTRPSHLFRRVYGRSLGGRA